MSVLNISALLARAGRRACTRHEYLGWVLARYAEVEQKSEQELGELLGVPAKVLYRLQLCLRPRSEAFAADVQQITGKFGLDAGDLARVIRHVESLEGMNDNRGKDRVSEVGLLMAARPRRKKSKAFVTRKKSDRHSKS